MREEDWLLEEKYGGVESEAFLEDVQKLEAGVPLAYLIGHISFLSTTIYLDSRPLIPRPETEYWVEKAIAEINERAVVRVLDLCAGSGCIGVAVLKDTDAHVDFVEIDPVHHETIKKNARENGIEEGRYSIFGGSLFGNIKGTYDLILTNPPYIDPKKIERTQTEVLQHEPHKALFGGANGSEYLERILAEAPQYLTPRGVLYIEHEPEHTSLINHSTFAESKTFKDQFGTPRFSRLAVE